MGRWGVNWAASNSTARKLAATTLAEMNLVATSLAAARLVASKFAEMKLVATHLAAPLWPVTLL
jgi:hypothetical protein